jgi:glycosyltransferase involved in cell wall biosynthesis
MGMGIPVLHGVAGESAEIVRTEQVGVVFEPENVRELVHALTGLREEPEIREVMSRKALEAAPRYDRAALAGEMMGVLTNNVY